MDFRFTSLAHQSKEMNVVLAKEIVALVVNGIFLMTTAMFLLRSLRSTDVAN